MTNFSRTPFTFLNKIDTLLYIKNRVSKSYVLDMLIFSVGEFQERPNIVFENISRQFTGRVIIRSSASTEDQELTNAGHYVSILNVDAQSWGAVSQGIEKVIKSYLEDGLPKTERIFVQQQIENVSFCGVALSYEPEHGKPYFLVNYDDSGITDTVTSGKCKHQVYIARNATDGLEGRLCGALQEIEEICGCDTLNIEFAITKEEKICIFQVRQLSVLKKLRQEQSVLHCKGVFRAAYEKESMLLSDMAFWNPSEMIGDAPHPLDASLYSYLVTDWAWNQGISEMGYFPTGKKLMHTIGNKPYIDVKTSFYSLTPNTLSSSLRDKLVSNYSEILKGNPKLHDKIEFAITLDCYRYDTERKLAHLASQGFTPQEIALLRSSLRQMTIEQLQNYDCTLNNDLKKLDALENAWLKCAGDIDNIPLVAKVEMIKNLLHRIRDEGVVPFARQARYAFIARSLCLSLVDSKIIHAEQLDCFMASIRTVSQEMQEDALAYTKGLLKETELLQKYGHLRMKTYDITSPTYRDIGLNKLLYLSADAYHEDSTQQETPETSLVFPGTNVDIFAFAKMAIAQREHFKFTFTKVLSFVLEQIAKVAKAHSLSREDISFLTIEDVLSIGNIDLSELRNRLERRRKKYENNSYLILPSVITSRYDFDIIRMNEDDPNFITGKSVFGEICILDQEYDINQDFSGKIIVLTNADPGYDWIFASRSIAGLITKYGGMASHMAIRCMEFGIPAAIGCGERIYSDLLRSDAVRLDCARKTIQAISRAP